MILFNFLLKKKKNQFKYYELGNIIMFLIRILITLCSLFIVNSEFIQINGIINKKNTDFFFQQVEDIRKKGYHVKYKIYFDTPGGSVLDGMRILRFIETHEVECHATRAYSMGFVLFQACKERKIEKYGSLMQHDMQLNLNYVNYNRFQSYYKYISKIYETLIDKQILKLGISKKKFLNKIKDDWWINAQDAIYYNCADEII